MNTRVSFRNIAAILSLAGVLGACTNYKSVENGDASQANSTVSPSPRPSAATNPSPSVSPSPVSSPTPSPNQNPTDQAPRPDSNDIMVFEDDFENGLSKWDGAPSRYTIETDPSKVHSGHASVKATFTTTSAYGSLDKWFMPGYDEIYMHVNVMFSEGFKNLRSDGWGMHLLSLRGNRTDDKNSALGEAGRRPTGTNFFGATVDPDIVFQDPTLRPLMFYTYYPDMRCSSSGACYGNSFYQTDPRTPTVTGQWMDLVFRVKTNTPGIKDGLQELWINGQKKISVTNMRWRDSTILKVNMVRLLNFMEENGIGAPQTEYIWWDDLQVWAPVD